MINIKYLVFGTFLFTSTSYAPPKAYKSNMYGQISFDNDAVDSKVIFHSYELVKIAQEVLKEGTWDNTIPNFESPQIPLKKPNYKNYKEQVDEQFNQFLDDLFTAIAIRSGINPKNLKIIMECFKTDKMHLLFEKKHLIFFYIL